MMLSDFKTPLSRILSFIGVGLASSAGYLAAMSAGIEWLKLSVFASAFVAFCIGTAISYLGNTILTFRSAMTRASLVRFLMVVLVGMGLNQVIAYALDKIGLHYTFIALTVFIVVPVFNFIGHSVFTYQEAKE